MRRHKEKGVGHDEVDRVSQVVDDLTDRKEAPRQAAARKLPKGETTTETVQIRSLAMGATSTNSTFREFHVFLGYNYLVEED